MPDAAAFRALSVTYRNGAAVQLGALGRVIDDVENNRNASWFNGDRAIVLAVQRQPGTNTVADRAGGARRAGFAADADSRQRHAQHAVRPLGRASSNRCAT